LFPVTVIPATLYLFGTFCVKRFSRLTSIEVGWVVSGVTCAVADPFKSQQKEKAVKRNL
jgi:hypothetical protein